MFQNITFVLWKQQSDDIFNLVRRGIVAQEKNFDVWEISLMRHTKSSSSSLFASSFVCLPLFKILSHFLSIQLHWSVLDPTMTPSLWLSNQFSIFWKKKSSISNNSLISADSSIQTLLLISMCVGTISVWHGYTYTNIHIAASSITSYTLQEFLEFLWRWHLHTWHSRKSAHSVQFRWKTNCRVLNNFPGLTLSKNMNAIS